MTDGIGRIFGGNNYGVGGYFPRRNEEAEQEPVAQNLLNRYEETQVDPEKIMDFMAANNFFVAPAETAKTGLVEAATQERIVSYMERFEMIYGIIAEEFGEELAPTVMDFVMDHLMDMAA